MPLVSVAIFKAPVELVMYELEPSWYKVKSVPSPIFIGVESVKSKESADSSHNIKEPDVAPKSLTSTPVSSTPKVVAPSICTVLSISTASRLAVPLIYKSLN